MTNQQPLLDRIRDLQAKVETLETQLTQSVWNYGEAKREVLMEKKACAKLADEVEGGGRWFNELPAVIRARGTT